MRGTHVLSAGSHCGRKDLRGELERMRVERDELERARNEVPVPEDCPLLQ